MSAGMPELGSKISLISKADIRYEGRLFTVDPKECTIALSSVRSFGTEDRDTQYPLPAQTQVYDYILFRGSDIKDIRVINSNVPPPSAVPNDPAIMQLSMPPTLGMGPPQPPFQPQQAPFQHPVLAPPMSAYPPGGYVPMGMGRPMQSQPNLIGGGSRSTTPASLGSRKSPTADQGVQANVKKDDKRMPGPIQPPGGQQQRGPMRDRKDSRGDGRADYRNPQQQQHANNRMMSNNRGGQQPLHQQQYMPRGQQQQQQQQGWGGRGAQVRPQQHHQQQSGGAQHHAQAHQQQQQQQNRGPRRGQGVGGGGGYRAPHHPGQGQPQQQQHNNQGTRPKNTLKFDNDYDFEQANTQFEELRTQLEKVKIKEEVKPVVEVNGDVEKKDDSGNETGAGECEQEEEEQSFYDKTKSFFDNISCEAVERSKGRTQRTDWRAERKLNSETFGVSSTRRNGYRGRGGYYNRGGYRQNYRGGYNRNQGQRRTQDNRGPPPPPPPTNQQQQAASAAAAAAAAAPPPATNEALAVAATNK